LVLSQKIEFKWAFQPFKIKKTARTEELLVYLRYLSLPFAFALKEERHAQKHAPMAINFQIEDRKNHIPAEQ
jgi:hypothetical protein